MLFGASKPVRAQQAWFYRVSFTEQDLSGS